MKTLRVSVFAVVVSFFLASCVRMDIQMNVYADDTTQMTMVMAMTEELADPEGTGVNPLYDQYQLPETEALLAQAEEDYGFRYDIAEYREDGYVGATIVSNRMSLELLKDSGAAASMELTGQQPGTIEREGEYFVYSVPREYFAEDETMAEYDPALLKTALDFRVSVTFPGAIVEHNAGKVVDGNTIMLDFSDLFDSADDIVVKAYAEDGRGLDGSSGATIALVSAGIAVLVIAVATVVIIVRRRRGAPTDEAV